MINERVNILIQEISGGNKRAFSALIGLSPSVIENIVGKRQGKPSYDVIEKIICAFENINSDWLITGKGEMFRNSVLKNDNTINDKSISNDTENVLLSIIKRKDDDIKELSEEIGRLKQEIEGFKKRVENCITYSEEEEIADTRNVGCSAAKAK